MSGAARDSVIRRRAPGMLQDEVLTILWTTPVLDEATHTAQAMTELLRRRHDRAGMLTRFVSSLTPDDEEPLDRLLGHRNDP